MNLNRLRYPFYHVANLQGAGILPNASIPAAVASAASSSGVADGAGLEAFRPLWNGPVKKNWVCPHAEPYLANASINSLTANVIYAYPFVLGASTKLNAIQIMQGNATGASPSELTVSVFANTSTATLAYFPGALQVQFSRMNLHLSAGALVGATAVSGPTTVPVGLYWLVCHQNGNSAGVDLGATPAPIAYRRSNSSWGYGIISAGAIASGYSLGATFPVQQHSEGITGSLHMVQMLLESP